MDRYESMLARVEQKKVQVKGQLPTFYSHLVDNMVAFVLDQVNECCNVAMTDATTDTNEDYLLADGQVARALDTRSDMNEQTNPQVDHHFQGSISNEPTVSPPSLTQSTIPANIEVKVEDESVQLCERVKKEEDDDCGEYVMEFDCGECEICRVKREMKEELDESGETEQMEDCVKQEIKEELEDGEMMHIKEEEEEEEDGEVEGERPNKIQRMDRVLGNVPVGSLSPSTNGIPINVEYVDDQVATSSTHQIEDHYRPFQPVTVPTPIVTPSSSSSQHVNEMILRDELLNAEPMMDNVGLEVLAEKFDREQVDHDNNSTLNRAHIDQDDDETEVNDNQNDMQDDETIENGEDPSAGDEQVQVLAENFVKRIEPADELGNKFGCDYRGCGKRMKKKADLISHIRTHIGEKPFKCTVNGCDRAFVQKAQLKEHLNVHSGDRPFVCTWPRCEARFGSKANLTVHLRSHTGSRPFVCTWPECGQAFITSSNLKKHSHVHSNERQFVCDARGCTKVYKRKAALLRHQKDKHN